MTCHRGGDVHQPALERQRLVPLGHVLGKIPHQRLRVGFTEQRWRLGHRNRAGTESFEHKPEARELVGARGQTFDISLVELDNFGNEQDLSRDALPLERRLMRS